MKPLLLADLDAMLGQARLLQGQGLLLLSTNRIAGERIVALADGLIGTLVAAGAVAREDAVDVEVVALGLLDTPSNRELLRRLEAAYDAALEVDRERFGPAIGTDGLAQGIEREMERVRREIHGGMGSGE